MKFKIGDRVRVIDSYAHMSETLGTVVDHLRDNESVIRWDNWTEVDNYVSDNLIEKIIEPNDILKDLL